MKTKIKKYIAEFNFQEFFGSILWAIVIAVLFRTFLFEPFKIPTGSMIPTLREGDYVFVSKYSYGFSRYSFPFGLAPIEGRFLFSEPKRGDIIVFKGVKDPETFYIKRLIGLPGDRIKLYKGQIFVNDRPLDREYVGDFLRQGNSGESIRFKIFKEITNSPKQYMTLESMSDNHLAFPDTTDEYLVPIKHYFFMGDNRNRSVDSRFLNNIGFVPEDRIVGKAQVIFWSQDLARAFKFIEN